MHPKKRRFFIQSLWRELRHKKPLGYFIPYRYAPTIPEKTAYNHVTGIMNAQHECFIEGLQLIANNDRLQYIALSDHSPNAKWHQDWFSGLDAAFYHSFIGHIKPRHIVEIGAGHSTRFAFDALQHYGLNTTQLLVIDPVPRANFASNITHHQAIIQDVDPAIFNHIETGDIIMVDSSHLMLENSDVNYIINELLPLMPTGTYIHFHDIFLPYPYPTSWEWRGYNEQSAIASLLTNGGMELLFASHYIDQHLHDSIQKIAPYCPKLPSYDNTSFWLKKV